MSKELKIYTRLQSGQTIMYLPIRLHLKRYSQHRLRMSTKFQGNLNWHPIIKRGKTKPSSMNAAGL